LSNGLLQRVARDFSRHSRRYESRAFLQQLVAGRLRERLDLFRLEPGWILDLGCGTGSESHHLRRRYRRARTCALDLSEGMLQRLREGLPRWSARIHPVCADAARLPLPDDLFDLVWSNLALQWCSDLEQVIAELHRTLRPGGLLLFTTFGPDTLKEIRQAWSGVDGRRHVLDFPDMHEVGDLLRRKGFGEVVMDVDRITLTYPDPARAMAEIREIGASYKGPGAAGLTTPRRFGAFLEAWEEMRDREGRLPCSYEVVYGQAWAEAPREREAGVPLDRIGRRRNRG